MTKRPRPKLLPFVGIKVVLRNTLRELGFSVNEATVWNFKCEVQKQIENGKAWRNCWSFLIRR